jgi:hypothetical protein
MINVYAALLKRFLLKKNKNHLVQQIFSPF